MGSLAAIRDALRAFGEASWTAELIVCDNNSTDRLKTALLGERTLRSRASCYAWYHGRR